MNTRPPSSYRILARLLSPVWLIYTLIRTVKDGGKGYLLERFGLYKRDQTPRLWIHAASVGEVNTVLPLINALQTRDKSRAIVVTTNTPTGRSTLLKQLPDKCIHRYLPVDMPGSSKRFVSRHKLSEGWIVETEIWPWLYSCCHAAGLSLTIINGRITQKTVNASNGILGKAYRRCMNGVRVLAKDEAEAERFEIVSNNAANVSIAGNLKYSVRNTREYPASLIDQPYCLAASTHDDEEQRLANAWLEADVPCTLVIVPRHPERGPSIKNKLRDIATAPLRSENASSDNAALYIADTLGELDHWYAHAQAVFIGGSLIDRGGQNLLEPARHARFIVTGPSMYNFKHETQLLENAVAIMRANTADEVVSTLRRAIDNKAWSSEIGSKAQEVALSCADVTQQYLSMLLPAEPDKR